MVSDLDTIKTILMDSDNFIKLNQFKQFKRIVSLDQNIAVVDGEEWKRHKRVINPAFKRGRDINIFIKAGFKMINYMKKDENNFKLIDVLKNSTLDSLVENLINEKREQIKKCGIDNVKLSLLTMLIQSSDNDHSTFNGLTDEEITSDVILLFIAGHNTTAHTLSCLLYFLSKNQDIQNRLRDEIIHVLGVKAKNINEDIKITHEELNKIIYFEAVINEGMRITPVATIITRKVAEDYCFNNEIQFKKGQPLLLNFALAMNDEKKFKNPKEFNLDRFLVLNENGEIQINKKLTKDMIGFSIRPRMYTGNQFSILEQKIFLILLLLTFKVDLPSDSIHRDYPILPSLGISSPKDLKLDFTLLWYT
ncbi:cytochrome P450 [Neoconidiobolus thromboides FSU 785]|nr:cytochrome P450 [Neoconidiobolus thromboides FSU 785]